jgi:hypothetical protein
LLAAGGLALLLLTHPLTWNSPPPWIWFPPAGVAIVLVAWLGGRAGLVVFAAGLLAALAGALWQWPKAVLATPEGLAGPGDAALVALEAAVA